MKKSFSISLFFLFLFTAITAGAVSDLPDDKQQLVGRHMSQAHRGNLPEANYNQVVVWDDEERPRSNHKLCPPLFG